MKPKNISRNISAKINDWIDHIEDKALAECVRRDVVVTGGCIASMLLNESVNDYDVYMSTHDTALQLARYYVTRFKPEKWAGKQCPIEVVTINERIKIVVKSAGVASENGTEKPYQYFEAQPDVEAGNYIGEVMQDPGTIEDCYEETREASRGANGKPKYRPVFLSTNAITLSHDVQFVCRFFGEPDNIHENYDFVHCTNYWTQKGGLVLRPKALEALLSRELIYVGSRYPVCSLFRIRKFIRRGWNISAGQMLKAIMQVNELDLTNFAVLEDQLTGVDCAYFADVLKKMKDHDPERVDNAYLVEIIERI